MRQRVHRRWIGRFFEELDDLVVLVHMHDAERGGVHARHVEAGDGAIGGGLNTMTKRARTGKSFGEFTLRGDSKGSRYAALDVNRALNATTAVRANIFGSLSDLAA